MAAPWATMRGGGARGQRHRAWRGSSTRSCTRSPPSATRPRREGAFTGHVLRYYFNLPKRDHPAPTSALTSSGGRATALALRTRNEPSPRVAAPVGARQRRSGRGSVSRRTAACVSMLPAAVRTTAASRCSRQHALGEGAVAKRFSPPTTGVAAEASMEPRAELGARRGRAARAVDHRARHSPAAARNNKPALVG